MEHYVNHYNEKGWVHIPNLIDSDVIDVVRKRDGAMVRAQSRERP